MSIKVSPHINYLYVENLLIFIKNRIFIFFTYTYLIKVFSNKNNLKDHNKGFLFQSRFFSVVIIKLGGIDNSFNV